MTFNYLFDYVRARPRMIQGTFTGCKLNNYLENLVNPEILFNFYLR